MCNLVREWEESLVKLLSYRGAHLSMATSPIHQLPSPKKYGPGSYQRVGTFPEPTALLTVLLNKCLC